VTVDSDGSPSASSPSSPGEGSSPPQSPDAERGEARTPKGEGRFFVLDGWRAISILLVLSTHMLPIGPKAWHLNLAAGQIGMSLFFTLSGFLITQQLHARHNVLAFFIRRIFRIVPLAWLYTIVAMLMVGTGARMWAAHLFFYLNYDFPSLTVLTSHFWSLCVVQFYCGIGLLMTITRFRGFLLLPVAWVGFLVLRFLFAPSGTIQTHLIVDEILSGACLALVSLGMFGPRIKSLISRTPFLLLVAALIAASLPAIATFGVFRGLFASWLIGHTVFTAGPERHQWLGHRVLRYIAETSYAMYVIHPLTHFGWLGSGPLLVKYSKRIISFSLTFGLAYLSTFYFEKPILELGKRLAKREERRDRARLARAPTRAGGSA
jgi:peptidoglycan/LPS O-acetylase OafA/YrhL